MDAARYARVKSLFMRALELAGDDRARMLAESCAGDPLLRDEVEALLACATGTRQPDAGGRLDSTDEPTDVERKSAAPTEAIGARRCPKCNVTFDSDVYFCMNDGEVLVSNPEVLVGTVFDEIYEIESMLGQGGMGTVYRARHRLLRDVVALKMLRGDERENVRWRRRFVREGQVARRFRHPNAVTVYDLRASSDGTIYLVLEFVDGRTLRESIRGGARLSCLEVLNVLEPVAAVLDTAHRAGVVHRDLKPENVMLTHDGSAVKLLDLGIAGFLGPDGSDGVTARLTQAGTVVGTPRYMSPEQWGERPRDGIAGVDGRADVYSLGVMAFELATGRGPFRGNDAGELRRMHVSEPPTDPRTFHADIPADFARAILMALSKDRADRFGTAGEFVRALGESLGRHAQADTGPTLVPYPSSSTAGSRRIRDGRNDTELAATITDVGPSSTVEDPPTNLPQSLTSFVGRHRDVEDVVAALQSNRLVTLLGSGGIGKTRLAIQAGREAFDGFPDGVWMIDLSVLTHEALVIPTIGRVLEVSDHAGSNPEDAIIEAIGTRRLLLVLDNCEHVISTVRTLVDELIRRCPHVRILATSRKVLGVVAEQARDVPALATPRTGLPEAELLDECQSNEAVQLFVDRARAVRRDFRLSEHNVAAVALLCRRLDGIPLALELAAARTVVMTPAQILARLEKNLDLLASRSTGIPDRHRTLRASIEWSYQLLPEHLQSVFALLSVFRGGWTLDAAENVLDRMTVAQELTVVDALEHLTASSLIVADESNGEMRFRMLETLREFATEHVALSDEARLRAEHARYFRGFVEHADEEIANRDQQNWLDKVAADVDNVRAALEWSRAGDDPELELSLAASMGRFWTIRGFVAEGLAAMHRALERPSNSDAGTRSKALNWAGNLAVVAGDFDTGRAWHEEALQLRRADGDKSGVAASLHNLGGLAADQGDFARADELYDECTKIAMEIGDDLRLGMALINRGRAANERGSYPQSFELLSRGIDLLQQSGNVYGVCIGLLCLADAQMCSGDLDRAEASFERCSNVAIEIGERTARGFATCGLGSIARYRGHLELGREHCSHAVAIARELGAEDLLATGLAMLGEIAVLEGNLDEANRLLRQSLRIRSAHNLRSGIASSLEGLALTAVAEGRHERAARFLGAASALRELIGVPVPTIDLPSIIEAATRSRAKLGDDVFALARTTGAEVPFHDLRAEVID